MLYLFYGTDTDKARAKARELLESFQKKKPDARVFRLEPEKWSEVHLEELIGGQGLFEEKLLIFADRLLENEEAREAVEKNLEEIGKSDNIFIFLEQKVAKPFLLEITEVAEKVQAFASTERKEKPEFNIFSLTDAFGRRDKKKLWALYQRAIREDFAPEQINGLLFWKVKDMLTAQSPNRYWTMNELHALSSTLVRIYHDAHRGIHDFPIALERLVLTI